MQLFFDAIVKAEGDKLAIIFTENGAKAVTDARFDHFDIACGQRMLRREVRHEGLRIVGYECDPSEPLVSMWAVAELVHAHFGINADVIQPS